MANHRKCSATHAVSYNLQACKIVLSFSRDPCLTREWIKWVSAHLSHLHTLYSHYTCSVLLDPRLWVAQHPDWLVVDMWPGMLVLSNHAHSVSGGGVLSAAWNRLDAAHLCVALKHELQIAQHLRDEPAAAKAWGRKTRSLVLGSVVVDVALRADIRQYALRVAGPEGHAALIEGANLLLAGAE